MAWPVLRQEMNPTSRRLPHRGVFVTCGNCVHSFVCSACACISLNSDFADAVQNSASSRDRSKHRFRPSLSTQRRADPEVDDLRARVKMRITHAAMRGSRHAVLHWRVQYKHVFGIIIIISSRIRHEHIHPRSSTCVRI